jgi:endonuclease-3
MSASNRAAILTKVHKVLKKHYKAVEPPANRTVLEHLLYAAILEDTDFETADECFAKLQENFFDWNEIRVTTITELAETLASAGNATAAAQRVKKTLQSVFETHYQYDVEPLRKQNLGKAVAELEKYAGVSPFGVAYVTQNALGGHSIACGKGALEALLAVGAINDAELTKQEVPGMERAIPKNKGAEFFSLLHQLGVDLAASPQSTRVKGILAEIDPQAKERLASWSVRRAEQAAAAAQQAREARAEARAAKEREAAKPSKPGKSAPAPKTPPKAEEAAETKKKPSAKPEEKSKPAKAPQPPAPAAKSSPKPIEESKTKKVQGQGLKGLVKRKPK